MTRLPTALDPTARNPGELSFAELQAMRLDGQVFSLVDAWCPIDIIETPEVRAYAVMGNRSERLVAARGTAAWIWGATPALPRPIELCADVRARARLRPGADAVVHEYVLDDGDVARLEGVAVTTPLRTLIDLARAGDADHELLRAVARVGRLTLEQAVGRLNGSPLPGRVMARTAIERALVSPS